jgi:hypothetical protein
MKDLKSILSNYFQNNHDYQSFEKQSIVLDSWTSIVGSALSKHCTATKLDETGTLFISSREAVSQNTTSSSDHYWLNTLRYLEPQILDKYEKLLGKRLVQKLQIVNPSMGRRFQQSKEKKNTKRS